MSNTPLSPRRVSVSPGGFGSGFSTPPFSTVEFDSPMSLVNTPFGSPVTAAAVVVPPTTPTFPPTNAVERIVQDILRQVTASPSFVFFEPWEIQVLRNPEAYLRLHNALFRAGWLITQVNTRPQFTTFRRLYAADDLIQEDIVSVVIRRRDHIF